MLSIKLDPSSGWSSDVVALIGQSNCKVREVASSLSPVSVTFVPDRSIRVTDLPGELSSRMTFPSTDFTNETAQSGVGVSIHLVVITDFVVGAG